MDINRLVLLKSYLRTSFITLIVSQYQQPSNNFTAAPSFNNSQAPPPPPEQRPPEPSQPYGGHQGGNKNQRGNFSNRGQNKKNWNKNQRGGNRGGGQFQSAPQYNNQFGNSSRESQQNQGNFEQGVSNSFVFISLLLVRMRSKSE